MSTNEIATQNTAMVTLENGGEYELGIGSAIAQALSKELEGLGPIPLGKVKIPSGGGIIFEVPGENADEPESVKELEGIMLMHHAVNAYWLTKYEGAKEKPHCSSFDAIEGTDTAGEIHDCKTCPHNQYGSDGDGKACKNMHRIYLLRSGEIVPVIVSIPPTSLKNLRDYIGYVVMKKKRHMYQIVTKITLKKATSKTGVEYSQANFSFIGALPAEMATAVEVFAAQFGKRDVEIDDDEYNVGSVSDSGGVDLGLEPPEDLAEEE